MICPDAPICDFWNLPMSVAVVLICVFALLMEAVFIVGLKISEFMAAERARRLYLLHRRDK